MKVARSFKNSIPEETKCFVLEHEAGHIVGNVIRKKKAMGRQWAGIVCYKVACELLSSIVALPSAPAS